MENIHLSKDTILHIRKNTIGVMCNNKCNGIGTYIENRTFIDCSCVKEFKWQILLTAANIPKKAWSFNFRVLLKEFVDRNNKALDIIKKYADKLDLMVTEGVGLYIQGQAGLAKSSLAYWIMKEALKKNIQCYAIRMSQLTKLLIDAQREPNAQGLLKWIVDDVQLIMIEEIEKDYRISDTSSYSGTLVNEFFSTLYDKQKSLLVTSNVPKVGLQNIHASNVIDRLHELADIILLGESYRKPTEAVQKILTGIL